MGPESGSAPGGEGAAPRGLWRLTGPRVALGLAAIIAAIHVFSYGSPRRADTFLGGLESRARDLKFALRGPLPASDEVMVIAVDERAIARFGRWPWPRAVMAELVERLSEAEVSVITFDIAFNDLVRSDRHATFEEIAQTLGGEGGLDGSTAGERDLRAALSAALGQESPERRLAEAIYGSGRTVLGLMAQARPEIFPPGRDLPEESRQWLRPFVPTQLYLEVGAREVADALWVDDPYLIHVEVGGGVEPARPELMAATPYFGLINVGPDDDGVLRRVDLLVRDQDLLVPGIALQSVATHLDARLYPMRDEGLPNRLGTVALVVGAAEFEGSRRGERAWRARRGFERPPAEWEEGAPERPLGLPPGWARDTVLKVPVDAFNVGSLLINYPGPASAFQTHSVVDVLDGRVPPTQLKGRIALVAVTALGTHDQRVTPFDPFGPGVYAHAAAVDTLLTGRFLRQLGWGAEGLLLLLLGALVGFVMPRLGRSRHIAAFIFVGMSLWLVTAQLLFSRAQVDLFVVTPVATFLFVNLAVAVFQWQVVDREKRHVRRVFQHYLAPSVLEAVLREPRKLSLAPEKAELTVLFSDLRSFTTLAERLEPERLAALLNAYLTPMTRLIFSHGGTLDKYMGDAIMAFWGDPIEQADHATRACRAALSMQAALAGLGPVFEARGWPPLHAGVGVNTGLMAVGHFGSEQLFDYTVMGDAVNLASRLEGATKVYGVGVLVSRETREQVGEALRFRRLDWLRVKGRADPVEIYELRGEGAGEAEEQALIAAFEAGLEAYRDRRWAAGRAAFARALALAPEDGPSQLFLGRCDAMEETPPGDDWEGVFSMTSK